MAKKKQIDIIENNINSLKELTLSIDEKLSSLGEYIPEHILDLQDKVIIVLQRCKVITRKNIVKLTKDILLAYQEFNLELDKYIATSQDVNETACMRYSNFAMQQLLNNFKKE